MVKTLRPGFLVPVVLSIAVLVWPIFPAFGVYPDLPRCVDTKPLSVSRNADFAWFVRNAPGPLDMGGVLGYIAVPAQSVQVPVYTPGPGSLSGTTQPVTVVVPGYTITETTNGYYYPPRWGIQQGTGGDYFWTVFPAGFECKPIRR